MPPRSDKSRRNVHQIQEMFAALGLPVCDDEEAIKAACEEQRGTRNRELNSTKGSVAARAQQWFDDVNTMLNKRDDLLRVVYDEFCRLADTVLRADIDGGRTILGSDTQISLRDIAMNWCRARSDLANKWLAEYLESRHLKDNEALEQPKRVNDFKAVPRGGRVMLTWTVPDEHFDEVRVVRVTEGSTDPSEEVVVYQGADSSFLDTSVSPKVHYTYRAYTLYDGVRSLAASITSTHKKGGGARKLKPSLVAVVFAVGVCGLVAYDHLEGDDLILGTLGDQVAQATQGLDLQPPPAVVTPPATRELPDEPVVEEEAPAPDPSTLPAPRAWLTRPPTLAFAGETLSLELAMSEVLEPELVDAELDGVEFTRCEFEAEPPVVRLTVLPLPQGAGQGRATWSFRLRAQDGRVTDVISGGCEVVH